MAPAGVVVFVCQNPITENGDFRVAVLVLAWLVGHLCCHPEVEHVVQQDAHLARRAEAAQRRPGRVTVVQLDRRGVTCWSRLSDRPKTVEKSCVSCLQSRVVYSKLVFSQVLQQHPQNVYSKAVVI